MKSASEKLIENLRKYRTEPPNITILPADFFENSAHHRDVVNFLEKMRKSEEESRKSSMAFKSDYQNSFAYAFN